MPKSLFSSLRRGSSLAVISFLTLYLELVVIRWLSSEVRIFAFFKNFPLLAAFLGFGIGCLLAPRKRGYFRFTPWLLVIFSAVVCLARWGGYVHVVFIDPFEFYLLGEWRSENALAQILKGYVVLLGVFSLVVALFASVGEKLGECFNDVEPLTGYTVNIVFSLLGGLFYAGLTWMQTGPFVWVAVAAILLLPFFWRSLANITALVCLLLIPVFLIPANVIWSPYYRINVEPVSMTAKNGAQFKMGDNIHVNYDAIMGAYDGSERFAQSLPAELRANRLDYYNVPYRIFGPRFGRVMVLGAGAGNDVAAALRYGVKSVDAVEIDPAIAELGRRLHPERPYSSDRVRVHITDGRAFLRNPENGNYDLIVIGALDSHTVFSSMSSIRLDNYVYTVESLRDAIKRLSPDGVIAVTFYFYKQFQLERVYGALWQANGTKPIVVHSLGQLSDNLVMLAGPGVDRGVLLANAYVRQQNAENMLGKEAVQATTDDWPFLFLRKRGFPTGYFSILILILGFAYMAVTRTIQVTQARCDWPMALLGAGFMLLETKLIAKLALLLGATWTVNTFVISAVLIMILLANFAVASKWKWTAKPFVSTMLLLVMVGGDWLLRFNTLTLSRLPWLNLTLVLSLLVAPVFFAGILFASLYQQSGTPSVAFGYNLLGAMAGGVLEYSSTAIGINNLNLLCIAIYATLGYVLYRQERRRTVDTALREVEESGAYAMSAKVHLDVTNS